MTEAVEGGTQSPPVAEPPVSPFARLMAIFVRPARAWEGLRAR